MEQELEGLGFESLDILQPSLLLGMRAGMRPWSCSRARSCRR